jgi:hypothetical protein
VHSDIRIQQAIDNEESNILILASLPDKRLAEKIETIDLQSEIAILKKVDESIALLETWRAQVIAARIYKAENNIPDAPNEIDLAIADIETTVAKAEKREETLHQDEAKHRNARPKIKEDNSDQMSLF